MHLLWFNLLTDASDPILGFTTSWLQAMARQVKRLSVVTMGTGYVNVPENVRVYSVGKEKGYSELRRALEFYRCLLHIVRHDRVDACFSHMIPIFSIMAAPLLKARGIPLVTWFAHPSLTWKLKLAHHLSDRMVSSLPSAYPYRHDKLVVVGQGIDTDFFKPAEVLPDTPSVILCVGRLSAVKNHPTLLMATHLLRKQWQQPFRVVILGGQANVRDKHYIISLHEQIRQRSLEDIVQFEPPVPMTALPPWYQRAAVCVNLTPAGFGDKVAWESMSCGRPCLLANTDFEETLGKYADCLLFQHGSPEHLAERLRWVLAMSEEQRLNIGDYLRMQVVRLHNLEHLMILLIELFRTIKQNQ